MIYYRRKVILSLLQTFNNSLGNTELQEYLFLFSRMQEKPAFDFVPYKFGCFSFQAVYDKGALVRTKHLADDDNSWTLITKENFISQLNADDRNNMRILKNRFGKFSLNRLMEYIYKKYPYYAINSEISEKYLDNSILNKNRTVDNHKQVFTIGYEGSSIERYLNRLINNNVHMVVDVRNNPISMKTGFSKNQLKSSLAKLDIKYMHMPNLGIPSSLRKTHLSHEKKDYKTLFSIYENKILNTNQLDIDILNEVLNQLNRIALTCFEKDPLYCHRSIVANRIEKQPIHI